MLAVTGGLELFGIVPQTVSTKLAATASIGDNSVRVLSANGWKVGDLICFGSSYSGRT